MAARPGISIRIVGDDAGVQAMLNGLDTAFNPIALISFLTREVTPYLTERAQARFAGEGDDVVGKWLPLEASTGAIRAAGRAAGQWAVGDWAPINVRTHDMENYVTSGVGDVIPTGIGGAVLTYPRPSSSTSVRQKMKVAQQGGQAPNAGKRTPPRPVLGVNQNDMAYVLVALASHIRTYTRTVVGP